MFAYYNEIDPQAAAWLRQLIKDKLITDGEVDERSIIEVEPSDLYIFNRVHFFAGIGTWDYCLNEAGWGYRPVWTASLPCQPFSVAGKGLGKSDERHLLPHFIELVRQCKPDTIFGEQVNAAIKHGWLDDLRANMEAQDYSVGHVVFGAHSIGAAHIRQRLYWVADNTGNRLEGGGGENLRWCDEGIPKRINGYWNSGVSCGLADAKSARWGILDTKNFRSPDAQIDALTDSSNSVIHGQGQDIDWPYCRDNKYRPIKSGIKPLVNATAEGVVYSGDPSQEINADYSTEARVMRLKGYGNAIVAGCGIEFISAFMEVA
jgi:DNA (cytosine-5)-methyltransferase 1